MTGTSLGLPIVDKTDPTKPIHGGLVVLGDQLQVDAHNFVWDPIGLAWLRETQPGGGGGPSADVNVAMWGNVATSLGQKIMANSVPVAIASDQSALPVTGTFFQATQPISAVSLPLPTGAATEATLATRLADATFTGRINTQGQKAMAASTPVVIASDQSALPVTGTFFQATQPISAVSLPLPTGAATDRTTAAGPFSVRLSDGAAFYDATKTGQLPAALVGGRLDANIGAWLGSTLPTVGQKVMASSLPVTIASDQAAFPVSQSGTWTVQQGTPPWTIDLTRVAGVILTGDNSANFAAKLPILPARANAAVPAWTEGFQVPLSVDLTGRARIYGGLDHDLANDLQTVQVAGNASPVDVPPAAVSAVGDRVRSWLDRYGANVVRRRKIRETYTVVYRLAEAAARLDQTFTHVANTNKQWATLHHTAGATKEVRLQLCIAWITSAITVAPQGIIELRQITSAPATGNPAITPTPRRRGGTAAESVALYLPTTAGTEANVNSPLGHHVFDEAVSVATTAFQHPQGFGRGGIILFDASQEDDEAMQPVLPIATLDGWAVVTRLTGATVMRMTVLMVITEEVP